MNTTTTIQEKLKDLRVESKLTLERLAEKTSISRSALRNYENKEDKDIGHTNLLILAKFYNVSTDYLLGMTDIKNHLNSELIELNLSDDVIDLLKDKKMNTRLLCEVITHKEFITLLANIEIFVDRIASIQINNINAYVKVMQDAII